MQEKSDMNSTSLSDGAQQLIVSRSNRGAAELRSGTPTNERRKRPTILTPVSSADAANSSANGLDSRRSYSDPYLRRSEATNSDAAGNLQDLRPARNLQ